MTEPAGTNEVQNPLTKPKFIIAAAVVALLVALAILLALLPRGVVTTEPPITITSSATTTSPANTTAKDSVCGLPAGDQSKPVTAPPDTKWELVGKMAAPTAPDRYGPGKTDADGLRSCFAHSPTGALYAAASVAVLSSTGKARLVYEHQAVPSPERDALLSQADPNPTSYPTAQIAGYQVRSYSSERAVVDIAAKGENGVLVSVPVPLQWYDGDWKIIVPASGSTGGGQLHDLSGYIPWTGV